MVFPRDSATRAGACSAVRYGTRTIYGAWSPRKLGGSTRTRLVARDGVHRSQIRTQPTQARAGQSRCEAIIINFGFQYPKEITGRSYSVLAHTKVGRHRWDPFPLRTKQPD
ncbi:hypothetical protein VTN02DRAFT_6301 [Thermoascus thermophilus]